MLLYTEKQLDVAYRIDCKARTQCNEAWVTREDFRPLYEDLLESYMIAYSEDNILGADIPEYLIESVNDLLESTLTLGD
jgi:hypothetical protein|tara:strand:- start:389 stop:625 length:237 start_codon:yes stop_codon:yes gene_type:complete